MTAPGSRHQAAVRGRAGEVGRGLDEMTIGPRDLVKTTQIPYLNTPDAASLAAAHLSVVFC